MNKFTTPQEIAADIANDFQADANRWTQGSYARDNDGNPIYERHGSATCFCLAGAIYVRINPAEERDLTNRTFEAFNSHTAGNFIHWNDRPERTVEEVIALCRKVAES